MATYRALGFVIKRSDYGEGDRILTLFTQYHGKVTTVAKGVRKSTSRKGGNVELFNLTRFQLAESRGMDLVVEAEVAESYKILRENLHLISIVYQMVELVDQFIQEGQSNPQAYHLFKQVIEEVNKSPEESQARILLIFFQVNFLTLVGFKPELSQCVKCGTKIVGDGNVFSPHLGGVVDKNCRQTIAAGFEISIEEIKTLRFFQAEGWVRSAKLTVDRLVLQDLETLVQNYLEFILEKDLKTVSFSKRTRS